MRRFARIALAACGLAAGAALLPYAVPPVLAQANTTIDLLYGIWGQLGGHASGLSANVVGLRNYKTTAIIAPATTTYSPSSNTLNIGGVITLTPGPAAGTLIGPPTIRILFRQVDYSTSPSSWTGLVCDHNPNAVGTTLTDGSAQAVGAGDKAGCESIAFSNVSAAAAGVDAYSGATSPRLILDGSGSFYVAFGVTVSTVFVSGPPTGTVEADGQY